MPTLRQWFDTVDVDRSGKINSAELSKMPFPGAPGSTQLAGKPIGPDVASKVISIFDSKFGREISFFEYAAFFEFCSQAQTAFQAQDRSRSGRLNPQETGQALNQAGLTVAPAIVEQLCRTRALPQAQPGLELGAFLNLALDIAEVRQHFMLLDQDHDGKLTLDEVYLLTSRTQKAPSQFQCCIQ